MKNSKFYIPFSCAVQDEFQTKFDLPVLDVDEIWIRGWGTGAGQRKFLDEYVGVFGMVELMSEFLKFFKF